MAARFSCRVAIVIILTKALAMLHADIFFGCVISVNFANVNYNWKISNFLLDIRQIVANRNVMFQVFCMCCRSSAIVSANELSTKRILETPASVLFYDIHLHLVMFMVIKVSSLTGQWCWICLVFLIVSHYRNHSWLFDWDLRNVSEINS